MGHVRLNKLSVAALTFRSNNIKIVRFSKQLSSLNISRFYWHQFLFNTIVENQIKTNILSLIHLINGWVRTKSSTKKKKFEKGMK